MKEIQIFIGYSQDAKEEVIAIKKLESLFNKELRRILKNANTEVGYLKLFSWEEDSLVGAGGQEYSISPFLEKSALALFIFKERIGKTTWNELQFCLKKKIRPIVIFPAAPTNPASLANIENAEAWTNLLQKKKSLTEDWENPMSNSITPVDDYTDMESLITIVKLSVIRVLPELVFDIGSKQRQENYEKDFTHWNCTDLNSPAPTRQYSETLVQIYIKDSGFDFEIPIKTFLTNNGFLKNSYLTFCGVLLFTEKPSNYIQSAEVQLTKYDGIKKSSSRKRKVISTNIVDQLLQSRQFIEENIDYRELISKSNSQSLKNYQYPMKCIREILANALVHRDYTVLDKQVYVTLYKNRIEIKNPGNWNNDHFNMDKPQKITRLISNSISKNMPLSKAISKLNLVEMEGSGLVTSIEDCRDRNANIPIVELKDGYVITTIFPSLTYDNEYLDSKGNLLKYEIVELKEINSGYIKELISQRNFIEVENAFNFFFEDSEGFDDEEMSYIIEKSNIGNDSASKNSSKKKAKIYLSILKQIEQKYKSQENINKTISEKVRPLIVGFNSSARKATPIGARIKFLIDDVPIVIDGRNDVNKVYLSPEEAECEIITSQATLEQLKSGDLNPMMAVMSGKVKIKGDMGLAMKLQSLLE